MKRILVLFTFICIGFIAKSQVTVTLYATGAAGTKTTATVIGAGFAAGIYDGTINSGTAFGATGGGYAVFDLSSIPAGATISSCVIGYTVTTAGTVPCAIHGFAGDLSTVSVAATAYADLTSGPLFSAASFGAVGNRTLASSGAITGFIAPNIGSKVSVCFSGTGTQFAITGETGAAALGGAPYLTITYCPKPTAVTATANPTPLCVGANLTLTGSATVSAGTINYSWVGPNAYSSAVQNPPAFAVTALSAGIYTLTATSNCGNAAAPVSTASVVVNPLPAAITPLGAVSVCVGSTTTLADATVGGTWSTSNAAVATVAGGVVTGVSAGAVNIIYTSIAGCQVTKAVTVLATPAAITPAAPTVCVGSAVTLNDATAGGAWSTTTPGTVSLAANVVTGTAAGAATVLYTVAGCSASVSFTVSASPAAITPAIPPSICVGASTPLADASVGGTWSSAATYTASVDVSGNVTGVAPGTVAISYTNAGGCSATVNVTVLNSPPSPVMTPSIDTICNATSIMLTAAMPASPDTVLWQDFNSGLSTWSVSNAGSTFLAITGTGFTTYPDGYDYIPYGAIFHSPDNSEFAMANSDTVGSGSTLISSLTSPTFSLAGYSAASISFQMFYQSYGADVNVALQLSNDGGATWNTVHDFKPAGATVGSSSSFTLETFSLNSFIGITNLQARFYYNSSWGYYWAIDNVAITGTPMAPIAATWSPVTDLYTDAGLTTPYAGTATDTVYYYPTTVGAITTNTIYATLTLGTCTNIDSNLTTVEPTLSAILGTDSACILGTTTLSDAVAGGTWTSSDITIATVDPVLGIVTGVAAGIVNITYTVGACYTTVPVTILGFPNAGLITGPTNICLGNTAALTDAVAGGVWTSSNADATISGTGIVTTLAAGIDTFTYTVTNICGIATINYTDTISVMPVPGTILGPNALCQGSFTIYTNPTGSTGGVWSTLNGNATITTVGVLTGVAGGVDSIYYTISNACSTVVASKFVTINPLPATGVITGGSQVCLGGTLTLTDAVAGGTWSRSNTHATVSGVGLVTGITAGTDTISYSKTNACGTASSTVVVTVGPISAGVINGTDSLCAGTAVTLTDTSGSGAGTWTASNGNATVAGGIVTGITGGTDIITYSVTDACGTNRATYTITVLPTPSGGTITGPAVVCIGSSITLTDATPGGTWLESNGNTLIAGPGIITGITLGSDTIFYSVTTICGVGVANKILTIAPVPFVAPISGATTICIGSTSTLSDVVPGGDWTSSTHSVATIDFASGNLLGISAGVTTVTYTVTNAFGCPATVTQLDTVITVPVIPAIAGSANVCVGGTITLSDAISGGTWNSSDLTLATVDGIGDVTGVASGVVTISYTVINICGSTTLTKSETVRDLPVVSVITGTMSACVGATTRLSDITAGGVWSSDDATIASVNPSTGVVTGVAAGVVNINYTVTNMYGCSNTMSTGFIVDPLPVVAAISGTTNECIGGTTTLFDATAGGVWRSSNALIGSIDSVFGVVTGNTGGITVITYSVTDGLGCTGIATVNDTVNTFPTTSPILGMHGVCVGANITLSDATLYGSWGSNDATIATVDPVSGVVTGVAAGTDLITYLVSNTCGSVTDSTLITVNGLPVIPAITGPVSVVCAGTATPLSDSLAGGVWTSSDVTVATVNSATGVVTGVSAGNVTITYTVTNSFGCSNYTTFAITFAGAIADAIVPSTATLCHGNNVNLHISGTTAGITFQWLVNGVAIPGATTTSYTADTAGIYSAVLNNGTCIVNLTGTPVANPPHAIISFTTPNVLYTGSFAHYQWFRSGVAIPGANSSTYIFSVAGYYTVVITDINGCTDTSAVYIVHGGTGGGGAGVGNVNANNDIKVYPNPATYSIHIEAAKMLNVKILSPDGKVVLVKSNTNDIDITSLANGFYMIMLYDENDILVKTDRFSKIEN